MRSDDVFISFSFFLVEHTYTQHETGHRHRCEKRKTQTKWCAQSLYTKLCEQQSFQVKDPFEDSVRLFPSYSFSASLTHTLTVAFALAKFFARFCRFATNGYWNSHIRSERDFKHSRARKTIKTKNKKRNKNRLPIRVPRVHFLFVRLLFLYFFPLLFYFYFEVISMCTSISQHQHQRTASKNRPKFLFVLCSSRRFCFSVFVAAAAAVSRFDVFTTLAIKSNLFFVVAVVVVCFVQRAKNSAQPSVYGACVFVLNVVILNEHINTLEFRVTLWQVLLKNSVNEMDHNQIHPHPHLYLRCLLHSTHSLQL